MTALKRPCCSSRRATSGIRNCTRAPHTQAFAHMHHTSSRHNMTTRKLAAPCLAYQVMKQLDFGALAPLDPQRVTMVVYALVEALDHRRYLRKQGNKHHRPKQSSLTCQRARAPPPFDIAAPSPPSPATYIWEAGHLLALKYPQSCLLVCTHVHREMRMANPQRTPEFWCDSGQGGTHPHATLPLLVVSVLSSSLQATTLRFAALK